jgi:hypothetical protein
MTLREKSGRLALRAQVAPRRSPLMACDFPTLIYETHHPLQHDLQQCLQMKKPWLLPEPSEQVWLYREGEQVFLLQGFPKFRETTGGEGAESKVPRAIDEREMNSLGGEMFHQTGQGIAEGADVGSECDDLFEAINGVKLLISTSFQVSAWL